MPVAEGTRSTGTHWHSSWCRSLSLALALPVPVSVTRSHRQFELEYRASRRVSHLLTIDHYRYYTTTANSLLKSKRKKDSRFDLAVLVYSIGFLRLEATSNLMLINVFATRYIFCFLYFKTIASFVLTLTYQNVESSTPSRKDCSLYNFAAIYT